MNKTARTKPSLRKRLDRKMIREARTGRYAWIPSAPFLRLQFYLRFGKPLHLKHPRTFNEKLQWMKLYDQRPEYTSYADKIAVRDYVRETVGEQHLIPLIAVYDSVEQIDWDALPNAFAMKCNHGSGMNIICSDKAKLNIPKCGNKLRKWMNTNYSHMAREWQYSDIKPRIIVEKFIGTEDGVAPVDYKIMCFEGKPTYILVDVDRFIRHMRNIFDVNWVKQDVFDRFPHIPYEVERPAQLDQMLSIAKALCQGLHHVRIDLYCVNGRIYFGEMTLSHAAGLQPFQPDSFDRHMGDLITLPTDER